MNTNMIIVAEAFYHNLYKDSISNNQESLDAKIKIFENLDIPKLDENNKRKCEELLSETELLKAVKCMKNGRSPGTDGLVSEFYKFFLQSPIRPTALLILIQHAETHPLLSFLHLECESFRIFRGRKLFRKPRKKPGLLKTIRVH